MSAVRRVDRGLGLAIARVGLPQRSLVTYARDHVAVRTPSRPSFVDGNTIDLLRPPQVDELARWVARFADLVGAVGSRVTSLRWEAPIGVEPDGAVGRALGRLGLGLGSRTALLGGGPPPALPTAAARVDELPVPEGEPGTERSWHAATVLHRYAHGSTPGQWRGWDPATVSWQVEVLREQVASGRARVWLATRHGGPVGRVTLVHDRQGLAALADLVVHPAHRRRGIGAQLVATALRAHLGSRPGARIGAIVDPGSEAARLLERRGLAPHAGLHVATSSRPAPDRG